MTAGRAVAEDMMPILMGMLSRGAVGKQVEEERGNMNGVCYWKAYIYQTLNTIRTYRKEYGLRGCY